MKESLEAAIKANADKAKDAKTADEALKYSQASLNSANALVIVNEMQRTNKHDKQ